ncbi:MAG: hypothetical protein LC135_17040 [Phycisphaerae bacterium]|nr:hypothetical protein [Phycisphaerae bacterium]MCZ2401547.1 hypothetical protein [Phycisphaerae bacterium]NUQ50213.1 hypothetical protein [Phycisphaerae bacterium]
MDFANSTQLDGQRLLAMFLRHTVPYCHDRLTVRVRYSRGAPFSGACYYADSRIFVNIGRRNHYPYTLATHVARARSDGRCWWREAYRLTVADAPQLATFVYLHELYHFLVKQAARSPRRKEAMCDRFAARVLVDHYGCPLLDSAGRRPPRDSWDFQDLDAFVARAPRESPARSARRPIRVVVRGLPGE